jgi:hypothetical protein
MSADPDLRKDITFLIGLSRQLTVMVRSLAVVLVA